MASQLHDSLYREHLEEASFLFEQRQQWLEDPQLELADVDRLEQRLDAHLDALVIGAEQAWPRCRDALADGDTGAFHAAIRVGARQGRDELLVPVAARLVDAPDDGWAAALALGGELHPGWRDTIARGLAEPALQPVLARATGVLRLDLGDALLAIAATHPEPWTLWALGELRHRAARDRLRELARAEDKALRRAATIAALKLGVRDLDLADDPILHALAHDDGELGTVVDDDLAHALALRGDARAVSRLTELLGEAALAGSAAAGLVLATGASLLEPHPEPDFAALLGEPEDPTSPSRLRPCRDASVWREHVGARAEAGRWRMGERVSPAANARAIATLAVPLVLRGYVCDELAIHHAVSIRPDASARQQLDRLAGLRRGAA